MHTEPALLSFAISVFVLAYIWFVLCARIRRDSFRADIRRIRDDLFDFMCEHQIAFESIAYRDTRQTLNGLLRFSNRLSLGTFFVMVFHHHRKCRSGYASTETTTSTSNKLLQDKLRKIEQATEDRVIRYLFLEGTTKLIILASFLFLKALAVLIGRTAQVMGGSWRWASSQTNLILDDAYTLGAPSLSEEHELLLSRRALG